MIVRATLILVLGILVGLTTGSIAAYEQPSRSDSPILTVDRQLVGESTSRDSTSYSHEWVTDVTDRRRLVGLADNVFVGTVIARREIFSVTGTDRWTRYDVEVTQALKGDLAGSAVVAQEGSPEIADGVWVSTSSGDSPLQPEGHYLLVTLYNAEGDWHAAVPFYGTLRFDSPAAGAELVRSFEDAIRNQISYDPAGD